MKYIYLLFLGSIEAINLKYAYGDFETERDDASGYPSIENIGGRKGYAT